MEFVKNTSLYDVLHIDKTASENDIKKAYRKLAMKHHPDKNPGCDDTMFKNILQAYEILSNPEKRSVYDETGHIDNIDEMIKQRDLFNNIFNPFSSRNMVRFNPDINLTVRMDLDDIYNGKSTTLYVERNITTIGETDIKPKTEIEHDKIYLDIDPGVNNGEVIILHGKGNKLIKNGEIQKVGNIKVVIEEISHKIFKRSPYQKSHIYMNQKISVFQALIGEFDFVVPGLNKQKINLNIDKVVIKPGTVLCVPNKGMKCVTNDNIEYGNLYVIFDIEFPNELTDNQRTLMKNVSNYVETNSKKSFSEYSFTTTDELNELLTAEDSQNNNGPEFGGIECNQQ